jgi:hypothetical protein
VSFLEFSNKFGRRMRVWFNDLPSGALLSNETVRERRVLSADAAMPPRKQVAIEVFQPFGASFHYGLLGGEYEWADGKVLEVTVPVDAPFLDRRYRDSLAHSLDVVAVGGRREYTAAIYDGVEQVDRTARPSGVLSVTYMAHGEIGSAPIVFTSLARALVRALFLSNQPASLDDALALLMD